ncbi:MAG: CARDB domain-containing protein [Nostoc sp. DedVER02]|uniref:CARDB domain-containing protein n=1 Tax=unclassified Nostoc TaxID=2593658 RepID=UPI002AD5B402|nr:MULTISPECIES: CARDB domain-containing protein [unclassified Nostoc]MDZ7990176.1 CARDB domain-containing protein [Nostoc sp. DedVER02]MDZ8111916.1 CARDB domain-containing protein [Nostoc sp. DedVER01b]
MFFTKDRNSINENSAIKASLVSSEKSNIFDNPNNESGSSLSSINSFKSSASNKNANQAIAAIQPDLIARTVSAPSSAAAGSTIQLSYQIENQGNASAGYSYTKFYLSKDLNLGSEDIFLGDDYVASLPFGYYSPESTTLTISNSVAAGSYYLVYQADGYNYVAESNENNNAVADVINITKPDLVVQNISNPSSSVAGSSIQLNYQIKNQGNASAVASNTKFYLSQDLNIGNEDVYLGYDYVSGIAAGSYSSESTTLNIGSNITAGNYYLAYIADGDGNVAESNETNNGIAGVITITPTQKSDLIVQNTSAPSTASVGSTIQLSYQIKNQGVGGAVATSTKFYISKDNAFSNDDVLLGSDGVNAIAAGATSSETASVIINNAIATGNYYLLYQADGAGNALESNETNNFASKAIAITQADLIIQNAVSPSTTAVGSTIQLSYQVKNQGVGGAVATTTKFYISKDNAFSNDDVLVGSDGVNAVAAGATSSETASAIINNAIAAGNYYLLYKADANGNVGESNETNNIVSKAIAINGPKPDLIIQNISAPSLVDPGSLITVNYQLANQGTASAGSSTTKFYLSKDTTLSGDDTYLSYSRSYFYSGLGEGKYSSESYSLILSSNITFGNYYLLLQADGNGEIFESNENNNVTAKAITIAAPDLLIQNPSAPASANIGTTIQLSYQVKNQGNGKAGVNTIRFYLSKDTSLSTEDISLGSDIIGISDIAPSAVISESASLYLSSTITPGSYYLLYQADGFGSLRESNENNNVVAKAIAITAPDLVIQNATSAATSAAIGTTLLVNYQLKNQGNGSAGGSKTSFYLSRDTTFGNDDDISLGTEIEGSSTLAPSAVTSRSTSITLAPTISAGKYYLIFKADGLGNVVESNEGNNGVYINTPITLNPVNGGGFNSTTGYGLVNAAAAVAKALGQSTFADVPDLGGDNWGADAIKAPEVWAKGYTGQGVIVAVIDSGVDYNHPDLNANIWKNTKEIAGNGKDDDGNGYIDDVNGWNFVGNNNNPLDDNGHGTHVAGTIAGVKNSFGVTGIAYNAKIMPVKVMNSDGQGTNSAIAKGIRYAVDNGANVINLSLGGSASSDEQSAIQYAASKGAITVMAAGNDGKSEPDYPAHYATQWGLAVGAVFYDRTLTDFSHRAGTTPLAYVTAPGAYFEGDGDLGIGIYSTLPGNKYGSKDGTSMAAPHVAGVVALMLSAKKGLTDAQVRQILTTTAANSLA